MIVWMIIAIAIIAIVYFVCCKWIKNNFRNEFVVMIISIGLVCTWLAASVFAPTINADRIAIVPVDNDPEYASHTIYYDETEDAYFYVRLSLWNPIKIQYRVYLDAEKVEECLELEQQVDDYINEVDLLAEKGK